MLVRPERNVRPIVQNGVVRGPGLCGQSQVPWGGYRDGRHFAYLGPEPLAPSPSALHRPRRGDHGLWKVETCKEQGKVPVPGKGHVQGIQGKVH